jgi:hypothetical protein
MIAMVEQQSRDNNMHMRRQAMFLPKAKAQHITSVAHEGKVLVFCVDDQGHSYYTVKQDGFEDSYGKTTLPGWEEWFDLAFPQEQDDQSVIDRQTRELTYPIGTERAWLLRSLYRTADQSAVAPMQLVSALGHVYVFRQSRAGSLLVDRFVLDGMTNKLNRKLDVRFKRSGQKYQPLQPLGTNKLASEDSLDYRDANGAFFYEPTTELSMITNLQNGWFSVVLLPTDEHDTYRWHIFAYNSATDQVQLTSIRSSDEGLFDVYDAGAQGVIRRTIALQATGADKTAQTIKLTGGLAATKYDIQVERSTRVGTATQLLRTATRVMLAIPTDRGVAALSFAAATGGTLARIAEQSTETLLRADVHEVLLPLNTLDDIKAYGPAHRSRRARSPAWPEPMAVRSQ